MHSPLAFWILLVGIGVVVARHALGAILRHFHGCHSAREVIHRAATLDDATLVGLFVLLAMVVDFVALAQATPKGG